MSFGALSCKGYSVFFERFLEFCTYKIGELRKLPLEPIQGKGFKSRGFTYLFPARGWKHEQPDGSRILGIMVSLTYSPQGDGNLIDSMAVVFRGKFHLFIPRKGMETFETCLSRAASSLFHLPIPRKGMETYLVFWFPGCRYIVSLTYSPQGDGNPFDYLN